ncbi:MAG: YlmC/YmxH family sporulation protein [Bacillota bacterium]|jgi:YlmC/YmxH family sporulation protein|nr:YlmC/YmxH family sporulation protein [Bacillota bacterium]NLM08611.1 YlmC/YmxH family sporulation protein [Clostridiales Family XIII bacterium]HAF60019.1 YlmC/YmxH family sporulation protein [Clostridiales bacterium UBA9856]HOA41900.1 YlmC/YmxH family sporulation protein [Bacillota bacterium]HPZ59035.1 YlmC/YmxH family sporulation protein [Bacillota bacterium]
MRLSDLGEKEIINIADGSRYGDLYNAELMFDERTGKIRVIMVPEHTGRIRFGSVNNYIHFPWDCVKKIGEDIIIVDTTT